MNGSHSLTALPDLIAKLQREIHGEIRTDFTTRWLYSTDASIYQVEPLGVVFPRDVDELAAAVELSARHHIPVLARGSGSSLGGQAIGPALILDCSRYLNHLVEIDPSARTAVVEPGLVLNSLNRAAAAHSLQFGPDPASAERATLGGSLANNATGAHSIRYGMAADHLLSTEVILSDGSLARFETVSLAEARRRAQAGQEPGREAEIYAAALRIRERDAGVIRSRWPHTWRRASGYSLNYLLPWSATQPPRWHDGSGVEPGSLTYPPVPPDTLNLAHLVAGSEGTLAIMRRATIRLVPLPAYTILAVLPFNSLPAACEAVPGLLERNPAAIELIPQSILQLARQIPAYARQADFFPGSPAAVLVVEFSGEDPLKLRRQALALGPEVVLAEPVAAQKQIWAVRKAGLGIMQSRPGDLKAISFIEDLAVPVEGLGRFVREMEAILHAHGTEGEIYAHASAGCLHIRPLVNLKTLQGRQDLRSIAVEAVRLTIELGGSVSGEHGDGLARSEWLERMYGPEILAAFRDLKTAADPDDLLNPGKIISSRTENAPPPMDINLRFSPPYQAQGWAPVMDFSRQAGLEGAIEQCNGAGVCRKAEGVMCPSFQATQEEMHSTRGRANLLRGLVTGRFPSHGLAEAVVAQALDLCLACKGCKAECPSAVDVAKLKYEFLERYYQAHPHRVRDYLFGFIDLFLRLGRPFYPLVNRVLRSRAFAWVGERFLGLSARRSMPQLARQTFTRQLRTLPRPALPAKPERVILLVDAFTEFFYPQAGLGAARALMEAGYSIEVLPVYGAGRTLISKGFLTQARDHARKVVESIQRIDPAGEAPVVGIEPSEIYTLRDEYLDFFPDEPAVLALSERAWMIDEFLVRPGVDGQVRLERLKAGASQPVGRGKAQPVMLHGHCYQKARPPAADGYPVGVAASQKLLEACGYTVEVVPSGCCGVAGAFGYEAEHYDVSVQIGELTLLPYLRAARRDAILAACGVSCQEQIESGVRRKAVHPITLVA